MKQKNWISLVVVSLALLLLIIGCQPKAADVKTTEAAPVQDEAVADAQDTADVEEAETESSTIVKRAPATTDDMEADATLLGKEGITPTELTVTVGQEVSWKNMDKMTHVLIFKKNTAYGTSKTLSSPAIKVGEVYTTSFDTAGTYMYWEDAYAGQKAKLVVEE
ncbi:hypothetical protein HYX12_00430 [Candidatus Woesearchaeota archaeon]|nr:hypothetical protein [Candidatus Woesearchaeota archaeon]